MSKKNRAEYMRRYRARKKAKVTPYPTDKTQKEIEFWTCAEKALQGEAEPECGLVSYCPDGLTVVSPTIGPVTIPASEKARASFS